MADEFNLNETTEEVAEPKKRGRKPAKAKVEDIAEEAIAESLKDTVSTDTEEAESEVETNIADTSSDEAGENNDAEITPEQPLITIEEENKSEETESVPDKDVVFAKFINVTREVIYNLPAVTSPRRIVSGRITFLGTHNEFCKVLYIAPGRGTDVGYMPKSRYAMYM